MRPLAEDTSLPATGLNIVLETEGMGSLKQGSPVYYRQVKVGQITGFALSPTAQQVWLNINIEEPYGKLIHTGTRFWNASGIKVSGGVLSGMTVRTESVESLIAGGIGLATPEGDEMGPAAYPGQHFTLNATIDESWLRWQPKITLRNEPSPRPVPPTAPPAPPKSK